MYVYKSKSLINGEFYIGISKESKNTYDPNKRLDPMGKFQLTGHNGVTEIPTVAKEILRHAGSEDEINKMAARFAKKYENDSKFLGLLLESKSEPKIEKVSKSKKVKKDDGKEDNIL